MFYTALDVSLRYGRLRRYLPRSTDLIDVRDRSLRELCHRLNSTPRRCLNYRTPAEVFSAGLQRLGD